MNTLELLSLCNERLIYNASTGVFTWRKTLSGRVLPGDVAGGVNGRGYTKIKICRKLHSAHRLAFLMTHKYLPRVIDHINGIKDDNRIINLRGCTTSENGRNSRVPRNSTSGYKGVSQQLHRKTWRAYIYVNNKNYNLGSFTCKIDAAKAYNKAASLYHGEFASLNVIP